MKFDLFFLAVHLWAEDNFGSTKILQQKRLKKADFQDIIDKTGPGTRYNLLKSRTSSQYKCLWRNLFGSKQVFRGHPKSGYENEFRLHSPSKLYCPFEHCSTGIIKPVNPLEVDLMLMTPERSKEILSVKGLSSKNLFNTLEEEMSQDDDEMLIQKETIEHVTNKETDVHAEKNKLKILLKCKQIDCSKEFTTTFGLHQHIKKDHQDLNIKIGSEICYICKKTVRYLDFHMKTVHYSMLEEEKCDICGKSMRKGMKKHRGGCIFCPHCGKKEAKRLRLLKHIKNCKIVREIRTEQMEPIDLSSPLKIMRSDEQNTIINKDQPRPTEIYQNPPRPTKTHQHLLRPTQAQQDQTRPTKTHQETPRPIQTHQDPKKHIQTSLHQLEIKSQQNQRNKESEKDLEKPRTRYPFDEDNDEDYMSELEEGDTVEFTKLRRENKDIIELRLREIDKLVNKTKTGDELVVSQFRSFMETISNGRRENDESRVTTQPSTVGLYTRAIQNDLLPVLHELYEPFDSRWLTDCITEKICTYEGDDRLLVSPTDPIFLTPRILRKAISKYDGAESGHQRSMLVAATTHFMKFIELEFSEKISVWGREPLDKVISYHSSVKVFIDGNKIWKSCNKDRRNQLKTNQVLKDIEHPNHESEKLESYKMYLKSPERLKQIKKVLNFAKKDSRKPTNTEFVQCGNIVMGEMVLTTGCRPVAAYRLPVGAYTSKKPGFDPHNVSKDDCVLEEEENEMKTYRRINPNLPPKHLACKHQIENKSATCPEDCKDKCEPEGFNILCTWDKNRDTKGPSYIHLPVPTTELMDMYDIIKKNFFKGTTKQKDLDWLDNEHTPFFLNSSGSAFNQLVLKHLTKAMGMDVTAYDFRRIVVTWATSHELKEIREAESETLRHGDKVAYDHYVQNKQLKPQTLIQKYVQQEDVIPEKIRREIRKAENNTKSETSEIEQTRHKKQHESLIKEKKRVNEVRMENKPLGPKNRILEADNTKANVSIRVGKIF